MVVQRGVAQSGASWQLSYEQRAGQHCLVMSVDGARLSELCGFDIPAKTKIGFGAGLKPGVGDYFLYGITSDQVASLRAVSADGDSEVETQPLTKGLSKLALRVFVISRKPVENVDALVGLDVNRNVVQRIKLAQPPQRPTG